MKPPIYSIALRLLVWLLLLAVERENEGGAMILLDSPTFSHSSRSSLMDDNFFSGVGYSRLNPGAATRIGTTGLSSGFGGGVAAMPTGYGMLQGQSFGSPSGFGNQFGSGSMSNPFANRQNNRASAFKNLFGVDINQHSGISDSFGKPTQDNLAFTSGRSEPTDKVSRLALANSVGTGTADSRQNVDNLLVQNGQARPGEEPSSDVYRSHPFSTIRLSPVSHVSGVVASSPGRAPGFRDQSDRLGLLTGNRALNYKPDDPFERPISRSAFPLPNVNQPITLDLAEDEQERVRYAKANKKLPPVRKLAEENEDDVRRVERPSLIAQGPKLGFDSALKKTPITTQVPSSETKNAGSNLSVPETGNGTNKNTALPSSDEIKASLPVAKTGSKDESPIATKPSSGKVTLPKTSTSSKVPSIEEFPSGAKTGFGAPSIDDFIPKNLGPSQSSGTLASKSPSPIAAPKTVPTSIASVETSNILASEETGHDLSDLVDQENDDISESPNHKYDVTVLTDEVVTKKSGDLAAVAYNGPSFTGSKDDDPSLHSSDLPAIKQTVERTIKNGGQEEVVSKIKNLPTDNVGFILTDNMYDETGEGTSNAATSSEILANTGQLERENQRKEASEANDVGIGFQSGSQGLNVALQNAKGVQGTPRFDDPFIKEDPIFTSTNNGFIQRDTTQLPQTTKPRTDIAETNSELSETSSQDSQGLPENDIDNDPILALPLDSPDHINSETPTKADLDPASTDLNSFSDGPPAIGSGFLVDDFNLLDPTPFDSLDSSPIPFSESKAAVEDVLEKKEPVSLNLNTPSHSDVSSNVEEIVDDATDTSVSLDSVKPVVKGSLTTEANDKLDADDSELKMGIQRAAPDPNSTPKLGITDSVEAPDKTDLNEDNLITGTEDIFSETGMSSVNIEEEHVNLDNLKEYQTEGKAKTNSDIEVSKGIDENGLNDFSDYNFNTFGEPELPFKRTYDDEEEDEFSINTDPAALNFDLLTAGEKNVDVRKSSKVHSDGGKETVTYRKDVPVEETSITNNEATGIPNDDVVNPDDLYAGTSLSSEQDKTSTVIGEGETSQEGEGLANVLTAGLTNEKAPAIDTFDTFGDTAPASKITDSELKPATGSTPPESDTNNVSEDYYTSNKDYDEYDYDPSVRSRNSNTFMASPFLSMFGKSVDQAERGSFGSLFQNFKHGGLGGSRQQSGRGLFDDRLGEIIERRPSLNLFGRKRRR